MTLGALLATAVLVGGEAEVSQWRGLPNVVTGEACAITSARWEAFTGLTAEQADD